MSFSKWAVEDGCHYGALYDLAKLWSEGCDGVQQDIVRSVSLKEQALIEGCHYDAMNNLATLLSFGCDSVEPDVA